MKAQSTKQPSYFNSAQLEIVGTFEEKLSSFDFQHYVAHHAGVKDEVVHPIPPKDQKSSAIWLAFFANTKEEQLFYVLFPSTKNNKKCFSIGMSNKGTFEEQQSGLALLAENQQSISNNPFDKLKDLPVKVVSPEELFKKCPEIPKHAKRLSEIIWETTKGNPCSRCNRPKGCKLRIYTPIKKEEKN
jgi:hypothetical protein